jgi:site-specific DNA-methyltransferase (adenine-specific)
MSIITTGVACVNTNRDFIGIELDQGYFNIAKQRIEGENESNRDA